MSARIDLLLSVPLHMHGVDPSARSHRSRASKHRRSVISVTLSCFASIGSMQITCASALPFRRQGKPSNAVQRMHVLVGVAKPSVLLVEQNAERQMEGLQTDAVSLSDSSATLGSCFTGGIGIGLARSEARSDPRRAPVDVEQRLGGIIIAARSRGT